MAMMISWVAPVNPSHPYLENDRLRHLTPTICAFHLGFSLGLLFEYRLYSHELHQRHRLVNRNLRPNLLSSTQPGLPMSEPPRHAVLGGQFSLSRTLPAGVPTQGRRRWMFWKRDL